MVTAAQLAQIRDKLFVVQSKTALTLPSNSVDSHGNDVATVAALDAMMTDLLTRSPDKFDGLGVGVADFSADPKSPITWLHEGAKAWRVGSVAKICVLLAAVQLRDDVQLVKDVTGLSDPKAYDALFADPNLWAAKDPWDTDVVWRCQDLGKRSGRDSSADHCPRPSTIFDFSKDPIDFRGPAITTPDAKKAVAVKAGWAGPSKPLPKELTWTTVSNFDFSELLWLMGDASDNVAATACISEVGVAYLKAVQQAYGLFVPGTGAQLFLTAGYDSLHQVKVHGGGGANYRPLQDGQRLRVTDALRVPRSANVDDDSKYTDQLSNQSGTAAALLTYMVALKQNALVAFRNDAAHGVDRGQTACDTIRLNLSSGRPSDNGDAFPGTQSYLAMGLQAVAGTTLTKQLTKIGLLNDDLDGEKPPGLSAEFAYFETTSGSKKRQYGVVVTGIRHPVESNLIAGIHKALLGP